MKLAYQGELVGLDAANRQRLFERNALTDVAATVAAIGETVRTRGDAALHEFSQRFDGVSPDVSLALEVPRAQWAAALSRLPSDVRAALEVAAANIRAFHLACLPHDIEIEVTPGLVAGRRIVPLSRVGAYVPGGRAAYPSTVLMTCVPAKAAGVPQVIVVTPPGPDGQVPDATLAACQIAGVDRVFAVGGAQAIFALAYGTATVPAVDKIVGPGNAWVAAAKAAVAGRVAIDSPAGPSEVLVIIDDVADAERAAAEMVAQAEHDPRAACITLATSESTAAAVIAALRRRAEAATRRDIVIAALAEQGGVMTVPHLAAALAFSDAWGPEHLVLLTPEPRADLDKLTAYGSAFLGRDSSVALGDYVSGPNHVLPTAGAAHSFSGLGVDDFVRRPTHQTASAQALAMLGPHAEVLARFEGLPAHAEALAMRRRPSS